jgi:hypothetical protein
MVDVASNANLLIFERSHEALANGVIGWGAGAAHANLHRVQTQDGEVFI